MISVVIGAEFTLQQTLFGGHADGVLWCVGLKDIVRFDGTVWTRIHHPDNRKIGLQT